MVQRIHTPRLVQFHKANEVDRSRNLRVAVNHATQPCRNLSGSHIAAAAISASVELPSTFRPRLWGKGIYIQWMSESSVGVNAITMGVHKRALDIM